MIDRLLTLYKLSLADIPNQKKERALREAVSSSCGCLASVVRNSLMVLAARCTGPRLSVEETGFRACGVSDSDPEGAAKGCDDRLSVT